MQSRTDADMPLALGILQVPEHWRVVEFISDLHLQETETATFEAWRRYMSTLEADALFILGDLFEVWVGDDMAQTGTFEEKCAQVLRSTAARCEIFFLPGNRDFLLGETYAQASGVQLIRDPSLLSWADQRWVLSHGDALCLDDTEYLLFRNEVRSLKWRSEFMSRPLDQRLSVAQYMRQQSQLRQRDLRKAGQAYADVDAKAALALLASAQAQCLIHGHTHRAACHSLGDGQVRSVLSDWDLACELPRADALRLTRLSDAPKPNFSLERISVTG